MDQENRDDARSDLSGEPPLEHMWYQGIHETLGEPSWSFFQWRRDEEGKSRVLQCGEIIEVIRGVYRWAQWRSGHGVKVRGTALTAFEAADAVEAYSKLPDPIRSGLLAQRREIGLVPHRDVESAA